MLKIVKQSNYLAKVVKLGKPIKHQNADKLVCWNVDFKNVITDLSYNEGDIVIYFPELAQINSSLLSYLNCFRNKELNNDKEQKGYFSDKGVVKAEMLRKEKSQGFVIKVTDFNQWLNETFKTSIKVSVVNSDVGVEFDYIHETEICKKYVVKRQYAKGDKPSKGKQKVEKINRMVDGQYHLHGDTNQLRKNVHKLELTDIIGIHYKKHGTSFVVSNILVKRILKWWEKALIKIGVPIQELEYDHVYGSRKVIKNAEVSLEKKKNWDNLVMAQRKKHVESFKSDIRDTDVYRQIFALDNDNPKSITLDFVEQYLPGFKQHFESLTTDFYGYDLWCNIKDQLKEFIPKNWTLYGEAIGYTKDGAYIQKDFDYGCEPKQMKIYIYKITVTNPDGLVINLDDNQIKEFCDKYGLNYSDTFFYYGTVENLYRKLYSEQYAGDATFENYHLDGDWRPSFIKMLEKEYNEKDCYMCVNKVPEEGIVLRKQKLFEYEAYKLKSFRFLEKESKDIENDVVDIEEEQSEEAN